MFVRDDLTAFISSLSLDNFLRLVALTDQFVWARFEAPS